MFYLASPDGQQHALQRGENLIGRGSDCVIRAESPRVSRHHAKIEWDGQDARIVDLRSTNGTALNGARLEPDRYYPLQPGDQIDIGSGPFTLAAGASPVPNDVAPVAPLPVYEPERGRRLPWPVLAALAAALLVVFAGAVWWGINRGRSDEPEPPIILTAALVEVAAATSTAQPPAALVAAAVTATLAPVPTQAPAPVAAKPVAQPPLNSAALPGLAQQFLAGTDPNLAAAMLGGTPGAPSPAGAKRYSAPRLVAPATGASYQGEDAVILLEWEPIQDLAANHYYWVMVFYTRGDREEAGGAWLKGTSYRPPAWFLSQAQGRFEWQVVIAEATGLAEAGGQLRGAVGEPSERRWFNWDAGGASQPEPPQDPGDAPGPTPTYGG